MFLRKAALLAVLLASLSPACSVQLPSVLSSGSPFIVKGTFEARDVFGRGSCPVWVAETGILYHLFQDEAVSNADFDRITTPGVTSRLRIATRGDLVVACQIGTSVVVQSVLEIVP